MSKHIVRKGEKIAAKNKIMKGHDGVLSASEIVAVYRKNHDRMDVLDMRSNLRILVASLFFDEKYSPGTKCRGMWKEKKPADWPARATYCDPNNACDPKNSKKKPSKDTLACMMKELVALYEARHPSNTVSQQIKNMTIKDEESPYLNGMAPGDRNIDVDSLMEGLNLNLPSEEQELLNDFSVAFLEEEGGFDSNLILSCMQEGGVQIDENFAAPNAGILHEETGNEENDINFNVQCQPSEQPVPYVQPQVPAYPTYQPPPPPCVDVQGMATSNAGEMVTTHTMPAEGYQGEPKTAWGNANAGQTTLEDVQSWLQSDTQTFSLATQTFSPADQTFSPVTQTISQATQEELNNIFMQLTPDLLRQLQSGPIEVQQVIKEEVMEEDQQVDVSSIPTFVLEMEIE